MKKVLKWTGFTLAFLLIAGFLGFLYFIPPFTLIPPEEFAKQDAAAAPTVDGITDPVERALAERGRYTVIIHDCSGCHTALGDEGPKWDEYLAGGNRAIFRGHGTFVTRNLTPDKETGLGRRTDEQALRVLCSGLLPEGRVAYYRDMPWAYYSNWTEEDRRAVLVYLRHLKPMAKAIPEHTTSDVADDPAAIESYPGGDVGVRAGGK